MDTLSGYGRLVVNGVVFLFLTPRMVEALGPAGFGLWTLVFSVTGFVALMEGGLGVTTLRSAASGSHDEAARQRRDEELSTLAVAHVAVGIGALAALWGLATGFNRWLQVPEAQQATAHALVWILGLRVVVLGIPLAFFRHILFGNQQIALVGAIQTAATIAYGAVAWVALGQGMGVVGLATWNLVNMVLEHLAYAWLVRRHLPDLRLSPTLFRWRHTRPLAHFAACTFMATVAAQVLLRSDPIIVKMFLPMSAVALYGVAMKLAENALMLTKQFVNVLTPLAADLHARGDGDRMQSLLVDGTRFALVPALLINGVVVACGGDILRIWIGPDFQAASGVLCLLVGSMTLAVPQLVASTMLTMAGQERFTGATAAAACVLNLGLSIFLAPRLGLEGVALATLVTVVVVDIGVVLRRACRTVGVGAATFLARGIWPALWPAAVALAVTIALRWHWTPTRLVEVGLLVSPGVVAYAITFWLCSVSASEKALLGLGARRRRTPAPA